MVENKEGGYIAAGESFKLESKLFIMGINIYGDSLWVKYFDFDYAEEILDLHDDTYMIVTRRGELLRINSKGDSLWSNFPKHNLRCRNAKLVGSEVYICGDNSNIIFKPFLLKIDLSGNEIFYKEYNFNGWVSDFVVSEEGIMLVGEATYPEMFLQRVDLQGDSVWTKKYQLFTSNPTSVITIPFENRILVGGIGKPIGLNGTSATLSKFDTSGNLIWHKTFDPGQPVYGGIDYVINDINGNVMTFGFGSRSIHDPEPMEQRLIKFNYDGDEVWRKQYGLQNEHLDALSFTQTSDSGYIFSGSTVISNFTVPHIIKTDKHGNAPPVMIHNPNISIPSHIVLFQNYPNPFNSSTVIEFELSSPTKIVINLYDLKGRFVDELASGSFDKGFHSKIFFPGNLSSGIYFYVLKTQRESICRKFLYIK